MPTQITHIFEAVGNLLMDVLTWWASAAGFDLTFAALSTAAIRPLNMVMPHLHCLLWSSTPKAEEVCAFREMPAGAFAYRCGVEAADESI